MKNNKSPGSDGFTADFLKFFYKDVKVSIRRAINESFKLGKFSISLRQGLITCIPKGDKPRQFLKNWRPITLLNVIYKIASGCIAERLKSVLTKLISSDQTGFISGRYIGENTRLIYDVMRYTEDENIPGILLIIDFEKAFDSISWEFITEVLDYFNFGNSLKSWISVLYNDISSMVIQNGFLSESFPIKRGCRQGDPPSPYIFLLCAEVLSLLIKQNDYIKGIKIGELELKLSQYADDTTILLDGSEQSLEAALQTLSIFAKISGLKVNNSKTKAVWIGSKKFSGETFNHRFKLDWNQNNFEILGIIFSCNLDTMIQLNYVKKLKQIDRDLKQWSKRILTPFGRITVLKPLIISKLNHLFISLPNPSDDLINNLQKRFFSFVWNSKTDRIKRDVLIQEYNAGGLKMININNFVSALKISWIRRLVTVDSKYKAIFELVYTKINNLLYRGMEFINELKMNRNNLFWNHVLEAWMQLYNSSKPQYSTDILSINLWDNADIIIGNKAVFYRTWFEKKIYFIKDLCDENGNLMNYDQFVNKYDLRINFTEYYGVRAAVNTYIRNKDIQFHSEPGSNCYIPFSVKEILKNKQGCKNMYLSLNRKSSIPKGQLRWNGIFETNEFNWQLIYNIPAKSCNNTKLHRFQYRILHRILATNDYLFKCQIKTENSCTFCTVVPEKLEHLFWQCPIVMNFWDEVEQWIYVKCNYLINIDKVKAIFGILNSNEWFRPLNYILILTRFFIYKCRIKNKQPNITGWKNEVKTLIMMEKMIAIKNSRIDKFMRNWNKWLRIFE